MRSSRFALVLLLAIFGSAPLMAANPAGSGADCPIKDPVQDYIRQHGLPAKGANLLRSKLSLSGKGDRELLLADLDGCGSMGCDYALYQLLDSGCYREIGAILGQVEVLDKTENGYKELHVRFHQDYLAQSDSVYVYDPAQGRYRRK